MSGRPVVLDTMLAQQRCLQSSFSGRVSCFNPRAARVSAQRCALRIDCKESRVGKLPVSIPAGVTYKLDLGYVSVKGPKGELGFKYDNGLVEIKEENGALRVYKKKESKRADETHGLVRAYTQNMVTGTSTGFSKTLNMIGVGLPSGNPGTEADP
eukprot:jgi/Botrbrau1/18982/Bobra.0100s0019.1